MIVKRGKVYKWHNSSTGAENNCVVVSDDNRNSDKLISILFLSTFRSEDTGRDMVGFSYDEDKIGYVHAHLVTYTRRSYILEELGEVDSEKMDEIDKIMMRGLGFNVESRLYKELYNEIIDKLVDREVENAN